jgi:hypothetical protein
MRSSKVGLQRVGDILAAIFILFLAAIFVGERYGTRKPTPGRSGPEIVCDKYYRCSTR